jgi:hypothetical protein
MRSGAPLSRTAQRRGISDPQIALYAGAMGAGIIASVWKPGRSDPWRSGYQATWTQAAFGSLTNVLGEFAPDIGRMLKRK